MVVTLGEDTLRWGQVYSFLLKHQHSSLPQISVPVSGPAFRNHPLHPAVLKVRNLGIPPARFLFPAQHGPENSYVHHGCWASFGF